MKSEPEVFSIADLKARPEQTEPWDGVRNYQARNFIREMQVGDLAFFYHSNANPPGIAGLIEIVSEAYPDTSQFDPKSKYYDKHSVRSKPRWYLVNVKFKQELPFIALEAVRANPKLKSMELVKVGSRLSIQPVKENEWEEILNMCGLLVAAEK